jgi:hypothetical protein
MPNYDKDYEATMTALTTALHKREQIDAEINALQKRAHALETLIGADYKHKGRIVIDQDTTAAGEIVNLIMPGATERIRGLLALKRVPLTSAEIRGYLNQLNEPLVNEKSNPWALIHGICRRLVEQGFAREVDKNGHKAWVVAK